MNREERSDDPHEIKKFRMIDNAGARECLDLRKWLYDKRDGKAVQMIQHHTNEPLAINVNIRRIGC